MIKLGIKTSCLCGVLICITTALTAQTNELVGQIALKEGAKVSYKLVFSDSAGIIKGYSISDMKGPYETKAAISGRIDTVRKTMSFTETIVSYSKVKSKEYCLLQGQCKITSKAGMQLYTGKVNGYINGDKNKQCGKGTVLFSTMKDILQITKNITSKIDTNKLNITQRKTLDSLKQRVQNVSITKSIDTTEQKMPGIWNPKTDKISFIAIDAKKDANIQWSNDSLRIEIYDDGEIDNDRISLIINDEYVIKDLSVTSKKEYYVFPLKAGHHTLKFHAENEGNSPPNTVKAIIYDGDIKHYISTNLYYNQDAILLIDK